MKKILFLSLFLSSAVFGNNAGIASQLEKLGLSDIEISSSPIEGVNIVSTTNNVFYTSGDYLIDGKLYQLTENGPINLTSKFLMDKLNAEEKHMIVFPAKNEKYVVTAFMDVSCYYCHLLFKDVSAYNDLGITMRFVAFPRNGLASKSAQEMEAIWTDENPTFALKQLEEQQKHPTNLKEPNVVKKQFELGKKFGVSGTPAIIVGDGDVLPGYIPPQKLIQILEQYRKQ